MKEMWIGVNYWDSKNGTEMWKNWDPELIESDLKALSDAGIKYLRVFPNWRDFQPVRQLYRWGMEPKEFVDYNDRPIENEYFIDMEMIERFREFALIADKYSMKLMVSVVTGWMSGRQFLPEALQGKNPISDPECLYFEEKYVHGIVKYLKDIPNIFAWDLGNECNNMGQKNTRYEAANWVSRIRNAIYCEDRSRMIGSGMHGLDCFSEKPWRIEDQSILDFMTTHPYPSQSILNDVEPYNKIRGVTFPTLQTVWYSDISGKPAMIQESGTFSPLIGNEEMAADFVRANIFSAYANGFLGYMWWCGMEHLHLKNPPYTWSGIERQLGILNIEKKPKPAAREMAAAIKALSGAPEIKKVRRDAVCILPNTPSKMQLAETVGLLSREAGFNVKYNNEAVKDNSNFYILPCLTGDQGLKSDVMDSLMQKVGKGATLYLSFGESQLSLIGEYFGLESLGAYKYGESHTINTPFGEFKYSSSKNYLLRSVGAEVIAENERGDAIFNKYKYGKGTVYTVAFPLEFLAGGTRDGFDPEVAQPFYKFYQYMYGETDYTVKTHNPYLIVNEAEDTDGNLIVSVINYSDRDREVNLDIKDNRSYEVIYGDTEKIRHCDALILKFKK